MPYTNVIHVTDLQLPELELYSRFSENQLLHYYEQLPVFLLLRVRLWPDVHWMPVMIPSLSW